MAKTSRSETKDNFSRQAGMYSVYRPLYPAELYAYIFKMVPEKINAWDCGTGNGQVARELSKHFFRVYASDISHNQLNNASAIENITYVHCSAEETIFPEDHFNLITVAQALHWFNFEMFFKEAERVAKKGCVFAAWCYELLYINEPVDLIIRHLYSDVLGKYWDSERKHIENKYESINFPKKMTDAPPMEIRLKWSLSELEGYLNTWSSVQKYIQTRKIYPVDEIVNELRKIWPDEEVKDVRIPLYLKTCIIK